MRKWLFALMLALALPAAAQTPNARRAALAVAFDLDGEAADADQVVVAEALTDTLTLTLAADPDICRLVDITVTDANSSISAGVLTVVGTDCWDAPLTATFTFAAGGSGVKSLTVADNPDGTPGKASGAYFKTITSAVTGALTGEGAGDEVAIGYTANSAKGWAMFGRQTTTPSGRRWVDIWSGYDVPCLVTSGATSVDVAGVTVASTACFENVSAGDLLVFNLSGEMFYRKVVTRTDADNVILDAGLAIPAAGVNFSYRKFFFSTDPIDGWIPVSGWSSIYFVFDVDVNANTGGVTSSVECVPGVHNAPPDLVDVDTAFEIDTDNVASAAAGQHATSIDLGLSPAYSHCRLGVKFGTGDDADTADEDINLFVGVGR